MGLHQAAQCVHIPACAGKAAFHTPLQPIQRRLLGADGFKAAGDTIRKFRCPSRHRGSCLEASRLTSNQVCIRCEVLKKKLETASMQEAALCPTRHPQSNH